jgi:hypothetical protein
MTWRTAIVLNPSPTDLAKLWIAENRYIALGS